jgi:LysM repeat protein
MRALALNTVAILGLLAVAAEGRTELELLQARCAEQERQISTLEIEIEQLRERVAFERRRARTVEPTAATTVSTTPAPAATKESKPESYTVKGGDTVSAISRRYSVSPQDLMSANGIEDPTRLRVGQKLTIPAKETEKEASPAVTATPAVKQEQAPVAKSTDSYTVQSGDTLSRVARLHGMKYSEIVAVNPDIVPDRLLVGQKLNVSGKADSSRDLVARKTPAAPVKSHQVASNQPAAAPKPAAKPAPQPAPENTITPVTVSDEISFGAFAARHNTTPERLNALNGLRLKSNTVLAKGSELFVASAN